MADEDGRGVYAETTFLSLFYLIFIRLIRLAIFNAVQPLLIVRQHEIWKKKDGFPVLLPRLPRISLVHKKNLVVYDVRPFQNSPLEKEDLERSHLLS